MARYEFKLPDVGEGVAEAEIVAWHVNVGDEVEEEQPVAEVMTDKATVEMESPVSGRVIERAGEVGDRLPVGSVLLVLETDSEAPMKRTEAPAGRITPPQPIEADLVQQKVPPAAPGSQRVSAAPAVRKRARDLNIDLSAVPSTGGDRIRHSDLDAYLLSQGAEAAAATTYPATEEGDEQIKVIGLRRRIADALQEAKRRIPHFSYVEEVDVTMLEEARTRLNEQDGQHLTLLPFLVDAICGALLDFPQINATFDDRAGLVTRHAAVHIGVATQTENGLVVPVVRDAQRRDIRDLAEEIVRVSEAARNGTIRSEELSGSTITITSLGKLGGIVSTPIINRPEVAIVGVNKVMDRPVAVEGRIEIRKMMNLSSSFDHRVVDGWDAASFIQRVKVLLEAADLAQISG